MKIKNLLFFPFKTCTIIILCLLIIIKSAILRPDETIKNLFINLKR